MGEYLASSLRVFGHRKPLPSLVTLFHYLTPTRMEAQSDETNVVVTADDANSLTVDVKLDILETPVRTVHGFKVTVTKRRCS